MLYALKDGCPKCHAVDVEIKVHIDRDGCCSIDTKRSPDEAKCYECGYEIMDEDLNTEDILLVEADRRASYDEDRYDG